MKERVYALSFNVFSAGLLALLVVTGLVRTSTSSLHAFVEGASGELVAKTGWKLENALYAAALNVVVLCRVGLGKVIGQLARLTGPGMALAARLDARLAASLPRRSDVGL